MMFIYHSDSVIFSCAADGILTIFIKSIYYKSVDFIMTKWKKSHATFFKTTP